MFFKQIFKGNGVLKIMEIYLSKSAQFVKGIAIIKGCLATNSTVSL